MAPTSSVTPANNPLRVSIPNNDVVQLTHTCTLALPQLPAKSRFGHIIPGSAAYSLLSAVKLYHAGCDVTFTKLDCTVLMRGRVLMTGKKDTKTGLWMLPLFMGMSTISPVAASTISQIASDIQMPIAAAADQESKSKPQAFAHLQIKTSLAFENNAPLCFYRQNPTSQNATPELLCNLTPTTNMEELAKYHHQSVCSPTKSAFLRGIANLQFRAFPGLTYKLINKHLPPSTATDKGHMIRQ